MTLSVGHVIQRRMVDGLVNNKLERMWKETVAAEFEVRLPLWHEENHEKKLNHNNLSSAWDMNLGSRE
jgi:hypothetical protein